MNLICSLYHGDCIEVMRTLPDKAAQCLITDPPFNSTDCHWGGTHTPIYRKHRAVETINTGDRHPTSILRFSKPPHRTRRHPTEKPIPLLNWLVRSYSLPGQTILDTFAGSCSTLEAALAAGRNAIGIERDDKFYEEGQNRLAVAEKSLPLSNL